MMKIHVREGQESLVEERAFSASADASNSEPAASEGRYKSSLSICQGRCRGVNEQKA